MPNGRIYWIAGLMVVLPLMGLGYLSVTTLRAAKLAEQQERLQLMQSLLSQQRTAVGIWLESFESRLLGRLQESVQEAVSELNEDPRVAQGFLIGADRTLVYPRRPGSTHVQDFFARTEHVWQDKAVFAHAGEGKGGVRDRGWHTWYWQQGARSLLWKARND